MLQGLGYAGFGSDRLDDWREFGTSLVGLQAVERSPSLLAFRMDDRKQRIVIDRRLCCSMYQPLIYDVIPGRCDSIEPGISRFPYAQLRICGLLLAHHPGMTAEGKSLSTHSDRRTL